MPIVMALAVAAAVVLPPQSKWHVEYADSMCVLSRRYGADENGPVVAIRPWPLGASTEFALAEPVHGVAATGRLAKATVTIEPGTRSATGDTVSWGVDGKTRMTTITVPNEKIGDLQDAATISLSGGGRKAVTVRPENIGRALTALRTCQDDLLRSWKIDPAERERIAEPAHGARDEAQFISWVDYPMEAVRDGNVGTTTMLWTIGLDGRVSECRIVGASGTKALDDAACDALTRRGRYTPATGKDGKPMVTHMTRRVVWRLP